MQLEVVTKELDLLVALPTSCSKDEVGVAIGTGGMGGPTNPWRLLWTMLLWLAYSSICTFYGRVIKMTVTRN